MSSPGSPQPNQRLRLRSWQLWFWIGWILFFVWILLAFLVASSWSPSDEVLKSWQPKGNTLTKEALRGHFEFYWLILCLLVVPVLIILLIFWLFVPMIMRILDRPGADLAEKGYSSDLGEPSWLRVEKTFHLTPKDRKVIDTLRYLQATGINRQYLPRDLATWDEVQQKVRDWAGKEETRDLLRCLELEECVKSLLNTGGSSRARYASDIRDDSWSELEDRVILASGQELRRQVNLRLAVNTILYLQKTEIDPHDLPHDLVDWETVSKVLEVWSRENNSDGKELLNRLGVQDSLAEWWSVAGKPREACYLPLLGSILEDVLRECAARAQLEFAWCLEYSLEDWRAILATLMYLDWKDGPPTALPPQLHPLATIKHILQAWWCPEKRHTLGSGTGHTTPTPSPEQLRKMEEQQKHVEKTVSEILEQLRIDEAALRQKFTTAAQIPPIRE